MTKHERAEVRHKIYGCILMAGLGPCQIFSIVSAYLASTAPAIARQTTHVPLSFFPWLEVRGDRPPDAQQLITKLSVLP